MRYKDVQAMHEVRMFLVQVVVPLACAGMVYLSNEDNKQKALEFADSTKNKFKDFVRKL